MVSYIFPRNRDASCPDQMCLDRSNHDRISNRLFDPCTSCDSVTSDCYTGTPIAFALGLIACQQPFEISLQQIILSYIASNLMEYDVE